MLRVYVFVCVCVCVGVGHKIISGQQQLIHIVHMTIHRPLLSSTLEPHAVAGTFGCLPLITSPERSGTS